MFAAIKGASAMAQVAAVVALALSLIGGVAVIKHRYVAGIIATERATQAQIAEKRTREVIDTARDVDDEVAREASPDGELRKDWQRAE